MSVTKRIRDDRVTWVARWREPDGRQRKRSFTKKSDAERFLHRIRADLDGGLYVDPAAGRVTVTEYAHQWAAARPHRSSTATRVAGTIRGHIDATSLGDMPIAAVRKSHVQAWATGRAQVLAPSTARLVLSVLRSVFKAAVEDRVITFSPARGVSLPRHDKPRIVPLTVDQVQALADAIDPRCRAMVIAQAGLGLRLGELLALRVEDVDFLRRAVRVEHQLEHNSRRRVDPKTPRSRRSIPLPEVVAVELARHLEHFPPGPAGELFVMPNGRVWRDDYFNARRFRKAATAAGLPKVTTHALRHHYASVLLAAGASVVEVAERLGHDNATQVIQTYGHLMPGGEDFTRRAVDEAWRAPSAPRDQAKGG